MNALRTKSANRQPRNRRRTKLLASAAAFRNSPSAIRIPQWWLNTIIGLFLLPLAAVLTQAFFTSLSQATVHHAFWATEEFWFFALGVVLWAIAFFGLPRPLLIYVFGHELTHALWVWMLGGRVREMHVSRDGGHIITDKHNFWIALAPYFFPLYSLMAVALYGGAGLFWDVTPCRQWLFALIGVTWAFHLSFTLWMIPKGQSDLTAHGTFFSLVVIFIMNIAVLSLFLVAASADVTWRSFGREVLNGAEELAAGVALRMRPLLQPSP